MKELTAVFKFDTQKDCSNFIRKFRRLKVSREIQNKESLYQSVGFLIGHTLRANISLGTYLLRKILRDTTDLFDVSSILYPLAYDEKHNWTDALYAVKNVLQTTKNQNKPRLVIGYYTVVPDKYLATDDLYVVLKSIREYKSSERIFISPSQLTKFDKVSKDGFTSLMKEIYHANQSEFRFQFGSYDAETWFELITDNNLAELIYLQQAKYQDHFDFKRKAFLNMVNRRPHFLADYAKVAKPRHSPKITDVWSIIGIETIIEEILSRISTYDCLRQYIDKDWEYELFSDIKYEEGRKKAEAFILERFRRKDNIEQTFRLARYFSIELFNQLAVEYIDIAASADEYMEIDWINSSSGIVTVNQTTGEIISQRWQAFMDIVSTSMSIRKYSIITKIKQLIQRANESSYREKEREKLYN